MKCLLSGDSREDGSTQNPTKEWKKSKISVMGWLRIMERRNLENCFELALCSLLRIAWACERQKSAWGPRMPSEQPCGHPRCLSTWIAQFISKLWEHTLSRSLSSAFMDDRATLICMNDPCFDFEPFSILLPFKPDYTECWFLWLRKKCSPELARN